MKKLTVIFLLGVPQFIMCTPESTEVKREQKKLTQAQKYGLIGLGAAAIVGTAVFGGYKMYRNHCYQQANKPNNYGILPLTKAIDEALHYSRYNDESKKIEALDKIKKLISAGAQINVPYGVDETHLYRAASDGLTDVVIILLDHGAEIDFPKPNGDTALAMAIFFKYVDTFKLLIDRGANPNLGCKYDGNALFQALSKDESMADYILEHSKVDIDVNARGVKGDTPLIAACRFGRVKAVETLLALGSDVYAENYQWADHQSKETATSVTNLLPQSTRDSISRLLSEARKKKMRIRKIDNHN